ncbi:cap2 mRNA methylation [Homalodisca vitripennis]|nr:cap2 mRNA methylation [Homalodisca vitripennis]
MFSVKDIPDEFKAELYECAKKFTDLQRRVIERNLDHYLRKSPMKQVNTRAIKEKVAEMYLQKYDLQRVSKSIVGNDILGETPTFNLAPKYEEGTFNDRLRKSCMSKSEHLNQLLEGIKVIGCEWPFKERACWFMFNNHKRPQIDMTFGQPVMQVRSSKFCNSRILEAYLEVTSAMLITSTEQEVDTKITLDVSQFPWDSCTSHCNSQMLECVSRALDKLENSYSLCIRGLPLLSQFSVATVFLLAHAFYQVGLTVDGNVLLCGYQQSRDKADWIKGVLEKMRSLPKDLAVLSLIPINKLCDPFYKSSDNVSWYVCVSSINNARLLQALESAVQRLQHQV